MRTLFLLLAAGAAAMAEEKVDLAAIYRIKTEAFQHSKVKFSAHLKEPQYAPLIGFSRPWSPGTDGPVSAQPVLAVIQTEADMDKFKGKLKGKIVLLDPRRGLAP